MSTAIFLQRVNSGDTLATASYDGTVKVWDFQLGYCTWTFTHRADVKIPVTSCVWHDTGHFVISGAEDGAIKVWDVGRFAFTFFSVICCVHSICWQWRLSTYAGGPYGCGHHPQFETLHQHPC